VRSKSFYVYILTNLHKTVLYTGVTNELEQRILEHYTASCNTNSFTSKYQAYYLLFYERHQNINNAIAREKEIKGWRREKKMQLINSFNPALDFLNKELFGEWPPKELTSRL
jgi:putative endonuclease